MQLNEYPMVEITPTFKTALVSFNCKLLFHLYDDGAAWWRGETLQTWSPALTYFFMTGLSENDLPLNKITIFHMMLDEWAGR